MATSRGGRPPQVSSGHGRDAQRRAVQGRVVQGRVVQGRSPDNRGPEGRTVQGRGPQGRGPQGRPLRQSAAPPPSRAPLFAGVTGAVVVVAAVIVILVISLTRSNPVVVGTTAPVSHDLYAELAHVPVAAYDQAGTGGGNLMALPKPITGSPLTAGGKPEVLYIGAEFCPYCAAERWVLITALARFGTFTGLDTAFSSPTDSAGPSTPTFTFLHAHYSSPYVAFVPVETEDVNGNPLQNPTASEAALFTRYAPGGGIPFIDIGNRWLASSGYDPMLLHGLTQQQIAAALIDPSTPPIIAILGDANFLTAGICTITGGKPAGVCNSSGVKAAAEAEKAKSPNG